jgi:hypothetical protein
LLAPDDIYLPHGGRALDPGNNESLPSIGDRPKEGKKLTTISVTSGMTVFTGPELRQPPWFGVITLPAAPLLLLTKHFKASARGGGGH